jgi:hypothetical protein
MRSIITKISVVFGLCLLSGFHFPFGGCQKSPETLKKPQLMSFETVSQGTHLFETEDSATVVFRTQAEQDKFVQTHPLNFASAPVVDYTTHMSVLVLLPPQSTGAVRVAIQKITESNNIIWVYYKTILPPPNSFSTMDIGHPYHWVTLKQSLKRVMFKKSVM